MSTEYWDIPWIPRQTGILRDPNSAEFWTFPKDVLWIPGPRWEILSQVFQDIPGIPMLTGMVRDPKSVEIHTSQDIPMIPRPTGKVRNPKSAKSRTSQDILMIPRPTGKKVREIPSQQSPRLPSEFSGQLVRR